MRDSRTAIRTLTPPAVRTIAPAATAPTTMYSISFENSPKWSTTIAMLVSAAIRSADTRSTTSASRLAAGTWHRNRRPHDSQYKNAGGLLGVADATLWHCGQAYCLPRRGALAFIVCKCVSGSLGSATCCGGLHLAHHYYNMYSCSVHAQAARLNARQVT